MSLWANSCCCHTCKVTRHIVNKRKCQQERKHTFATTVECMFWAWGHSLKNQCIIAGPLWQYQKLINYEENCQPDAVTASMEEEREQSATKLLILQMWWMQNALTEKPGQKRYKKKTSGQASTLPSHRKAGKYRWPPTCFYKHRPCSKKYEDVPQKKENARKQKKKRQTSEEN